MHCSILQYTVVQVSPKTLQYTVLHLYCSILQYFFTWAGNVQHLVRKFSSTIQLLIKRNVCLLLHVRAWKGIMPEILWSISRISNSTRGQSDNATDVFRLGCSRDARRIFCGKKSLLLIFNNKYCLNLNNNYITILTSNNWSWIDWTIDYLFDNIFMNNYSHSLYYYRLIPRYSPKGRSLETFWKRIR